MSTIYHLDTSRSERIVRLMEELGLPHELEVFERRPDIFAPDELKQVHPLGRAPVIRDGETVLAESGGLSSTSSCATGAAGWRWRPRNRISRGIRTGCTTPRAA